MRAAFYTFGCKLNQYETEALASAFRNQGFSVVSLHEGCLQESDVYLINTCTVTSKSEQKARRLIRALSRGHPDSLLVVTGCYAQCDGEAVRALGPNIVVVPQARKDALLDFPLFLKRVDGGGGEGRRDLAREYFARLDASAGDPFRFRVASYSFHSRAFLKIQDGCDNACAFCRVPLARGGSVSLEPERVYERLQEIERAGYREAVLTGVNISSYRCGGLRLPELLAEALARSTSLRIRLSSLEPEAVSPPLAEVLKEPRLRPHFHLPVQSGSDRVLAAMRRGYTAAKVEEAVDMLRAAKPGAFLAADLIVGFPGESEEDFTLTLDLAARLRFAKLHVFPFSPRPGTPAWGLGGRVPERVRDQRVRRLVDLCERLYRLYAEQWRGREVEMVLEGRQAHGGGEGWRGLSENYLKILVGGVPGALARSGGLVRVRIDDIGAVCRGSFLAGA